MEQLDLSDFFNTKVQANDFSIRLTSISQKIYENNFNLDNALIEHFGVTKRDKFIIFLRDNTVDIQSGTALKEFFDKIQEKISTLSVLSLTLAFEPDEQTLKALSAWFLANLNKQVLFDITVDSNLIAGTAINFNGKYLDFSIKPTFNRVLKETVTNSVVPTVSQKETPVKEHQNVENISFGR